MTIAIYQITMKFKNSGFTAIGVALIAVLYTFSAFKDRDGFIIKGHIDGVTSGTVYLSHQYYKDEITDSAIVKNGDFVFKGVVAEPLAYTIKLSGADRQQLLLFVENTNITVHANKDSLFKADITGSATQDAWKAYLKAWKPVTQYAGKYYHLSDSVNKAYRNKPDSAARAFLKGEYSKLEDLDFQMHQEFFKEHPASVICAYVVNTHFIAYFQFDKAAKLFALLNDNVKKSYYGKQVTQSVEIEKRSGIGAKPDFVMNDVNGKPVKLSSFKGKYVLVDFWASWCGPCRRENPNVLANYNKYHDKGLEIVGISLDKDKAAWLKAIQTDRLPWIHVSDLKGWNNAAAVEFGVKVVPTNFLLDKDGKVIAKNIREEELGNKLKSIFNN